MANVYTDIAKWDDDWFLSLTPKFKCAWQYICDNVDGCGVLKLSFAKLSFCVGETITREEFNDFFGERITWIKSDEIWVPGTLARIYKTLSAIPAHFNAARKILRITEGVKLNERGAKARNRFESFIADSYPTPEQAPDSNRAEPIEKRKDKGERIKNKKKGESEGKTSDFDFETLYQAYPRHEGKAAGLKRIAEQVGDSPEKFEQFSRSVFHYAGLCAKRHTAIDKIKMFSSFVGSKREGFPWLEYIERPRELDQTAPGIHRAGPSLVPGIALDATGEAWVREITNAIQTHEREGLNHLPTVPADFSNRLHTVWGSWVSVGVHNAMKEIRHYVAAYRKHSAEVSA